MKVDFIFDEGSSKEDAYLIRDKMFGVFDGFNSLNKFMDKNGKTGGLIAATITRDEFSKDNKGLLELMLEANQKIKEKMSNLKVDTNDQGNVWGTSSAIVRIKNNSFEWTQIGDSLILVIYRDNSFKVLVDDYDHDEEVLSIWAKFAKRKIENIRELIDRDYLAKLRNKMNKTYGCLNGDEKVKSFIKQGEEKIKNAKSILLFTDGLFIPKKNPLGRDNWSMFTKLFLEGGLKRIKDFVRNLEKADPKCWKYPRYKQYDDIAAISISFEK